MEVNAPLDHYLTQLENILSALPTADRAEMILETKKRLEEAKAKEPSADWSQVLRHYGDPEFVAKKYSQEKGFILTSPDRTFPVKLFLLIFLGAIAMLAVFVTVIIYMFTPLISVDEATGNLLLLGGTVDVETSEIMSQLSKKGPFVFGTIEGVQPVPETIKGIELKFGAGAIRIDYNTNNEINWDCDGAGKNTKTEVDEARAVLKLDMSAAFVDCDMSVPLRPLKIEGLSGELEVRQIQSDLDINMLSGEILLDPQPGVPYDFELKVDSGNAEDFDSSPRADAKKIKVDLKYGSVRALD